jgi:hypothetical protein
MALIFITKQPITDIPNRESASFILCSALLTTSIDTDIWIVFPNAFERVAKGQIVTLFRFYSFGRDAGDAGADFNAVDIFCAACLCKLSK